MGTNDSRKSRRTYLKGIGTAAIAGTAGCVSQITGSGDEFPSETISLIVPYGTAGGYNAYTRLVAKYFEEEVPVDVKVENIEGAGGRVAMGQVYNSDPDGYKIILANGPAFALQQIIRDDLDFDMTEVTYFSQVVKDIEAFGVAPDRDIDNWEDFVSKAQEGELTFGSNGWTNVGTTLPLTTGKISGLWEPSSVLENTVIYDGRGPMIPAMERGDIDVMCGTYHSILPFEKSDDLKIISVGTTDDEPPEQTPNAETLATTDVEGADKISKMNGGVRVFVGPPDVPEERQSYLEEKFGKVIQSDELQEEANEIDRPILYGDAETARENEIGYLESWKQNLDLLEELQARADE